MKPQASEKSRKRNSRRMASRPSTRRQCGSPAASPARAVASSRSIIAPFLVIIFALPVYTVAGATLIGTFVTSVAGVAFFELLARTGVGPESAAIAPDWLLGTTLGIGGLAGTYAGARLQRYLPDFWIRAVLGTLVTLLALRYVF